MVGLYGCPTIVNNVETIVCVPLILEKGPDWFASYGTEKNGGPKLYCVSGHVARPGVYEAPMGRLTLRQLIMEEGYGGGVPNGRKLKAVIPGGSSTPILLPGEIDCPLDFDGARHPVAARGWWNVPLEVAGVALCWWVVRRAELTDPARRAWFRRTGQLALPAR